MNTRFLLVSAVLIFNLCRSETECQDQCDSLDVQLLYYGKLSEYNTDDIIYHDSNEDEHDRTSVRRLVELHGSIDADQRHRDDIICYTYYIDTYYVEPIAGFVLAACNGDYHGVNDEDLDALITKQYGGDSYSGYTVGDIMGIKIDVKVKHDDDAIKFTLCMADINDAGYTSNAIWFKNHNENSCICAGPQIHGLPCLQDLHDGDTHAAVGDDDVPFEKVAMNQPHGGPHGNSDSNSFKHSTSSHSYSDSSSNSYSHSSSDPGYGPGGDHGGGPGGDYEGGHGGGHDGGDHGGPHHGGGIGGGHGSRSYSNSHSISYSHSASDSNDGGLEIWRIGPMEGPHHGGDGVLNHDSNNNDNVESKVADNVESVSWFDSHKTMVFSFVCIITVCIFVCISFICLWRHYIKPKWNKHESQISSESVTFSRENKI